MSQYFSLLLMLFVLCVASSNSISAKVVDVDVICREASNPTYCSNLLNSKQGGAKGVDLVDLAEYTIDVLSENWTNTYNLINKLINNAENSMVANYYYRCSIDFMNKDSVANSLGDALLNLNIGNYPAMAKAITDVKQYLFDCIDSLRKNKTSPLLPKYVDVLQQGNQVLQIITKYLNLEK
ncbi:putative pectinesterase inhibitor domain-containing protein [Medicago truncatula]|uniref:Putative pectinesterase inhibitor domain-containing protein n=1 Tax=Medicago truncatula TaxID=3880 RepID=A0A396HIC0_MEDTR|nr:putative pectinesterase inhibitor domain-containing protein [Medicago truncatula]